MRHTLRAPKAFSGRRESGQSTTDIARSYETWKIALKYYLQNEFTYNFGRQASDEEQLSFAIQFLEDDALQAAEAALVRFARKNPTETGTWNDVLSVLDKHYALPSAPSDLVGAIDKLEQEWNESVEAFTARFESIHRRLVTLELTNKGTSEIWYVKALRPAIRFHLRERLAADRPLDSYADDDCIGVIDHLRRMANAKERADQERNQGRERVGHERTQAGFQSRNQSGRSERQNRSSNWRDASMSDRRVADKPPPQVNAMSMVASYASRLGLAESVIQKRFDLNQCLYCAASDHAARDCPKRRQPRVNALEAAAEAVDRTETTNEKKADNEDQKN